MVMPVTQPERGTRTADRPALAPRFHLVLLDDNDHSYEYVIELLGHVLGYGPEKSFVLARVVDTQGRAIVETAGHAQVTGHQRQIHAFGADPRIERSKGS